MEAGTELQAGTDSKEHGSTSKTTPSVAPSEELKVGPKQVTRGLLPSSITRLASRLFQKQGLREVEQQTTQEMVAESKTSLSGGTPALHTQRDTQSVLEDSARLRADTLDMDTSSRAAIETTKTTKKIFPLQFWNSTHSSFKATPQQLSPRSHLSSNPPIEHALWNPPEPKPLPEAGHIFALTIHVAQPLVPELRLTSPVVRLHCVDRTSGQYLKKTDAARPAVVHNEACDYVMPTQTKPFDLKHRGRGGALSAAWEECLLLNEEAVRFFSPDALLLLEVLQLPSSLKKQKRRGLAGTPAWKLRDGHYRVAWAYLAPRSPTEDPHLGRVSLQLYHYAPPPRFRSRESSEVFATWQSLCDPNASARARRKRARRLLYPGSIAVTLAAVPRPGEDTVVAAPQVGVRGLLANQIESGRLDAEDLLQEWQDKNQGGERARATELMLTEDDISASQHARAAHEPCAVPTVLQHRLATGSRGCVRVRFSPSGRFLAVVASDALLFPLQVFSAHSGALLATFQGHRSLVYDLSWDADDSSILTASSDFTAKLWNFSPGARTGRPATGAKQPGGATGAPTTVLQHPCYVYAAAFHPTAMAPRLIATAAFDGLVRLWDRDNGELRRQVQLHTTYINALIFDHVGKRLFTGDGAGHVTECSCDFSPSGGGLKPLRTSTELGGDPISCLRLHPGGRRLFVLARRNRLVGIDSRLFTVDRRYKGLRCENHPVSFDVSPDGRYLVSGSEDGRAYMWQVDSAAGFAPFPPAALRSDAVYDCSWNPVEHTVAVATVGAGSPGLIFCPDPSLVQQIDSQATLPVPLGTFMTGTGTGTMLGFSPDYSLPSEVRTLMRSGRSLPVEKFTPDKIKTMLGTLRATDAQRAAAAATAAPADAGYGAPKGSDVKWRAGLELREHLEHDGNGANERLDGPQYGNATQEPLESLERGEQRLEKEESGGEARRRSSSSTDVSDRQTEQVPAEGLGNSKGKGERNKAKAAQKKSVPPVSGQVGADLAMFGRNGQTDGHFGRTESSAGSARTDSPAARRRSSDGTSAAEGDVTPERNLRPSAAEQTAVAGEGMGTLSGSDGARRGGSEKLGVKKTPSGAGSGSGSGDGTPKRGVRRSEERNNKVGERATKESATGQSSRPEVRGSGTSERAEGRNERESGSGTESGIWAEERNGGTESGSGREERNDGSQRGTTKGKRLSKSRSGHKEGADWERGDEPNAGIDRNSGRGATLRRISSTLKRKLKLNLKDLDPGRGGTEYKGYDSGFQQEKDKSRQSEEGSDGSLAQAEKRKGKQKTSTEPGLTSRLAKVLDPRERIKARLERQRSRGPPLV